MLIHANRPIARSARLTTVLKEILHSTVLPPGLSKRLSRQDQFTTKLKIEWGKTKVESSFQHRTPKTWNKIVIEVDTAMTEAVAAYLERLSENGIEITSSMKDPEIEKI